MQQNDDKSDPPRIKGISVMQEWCEIKLEKAGKFYIFDLRMKDVAIILIDTWEQLITNKHRENINTLLNKAREHRIPIFHANYGNKSGIFIHKKDIILQDYCSVKDMPKYIFYAGYEIDKCLLGRSVGIPFAMYENKTPILIKDLTDSISEYNNLSTYLMKQAAINIIEHCYGFTTTFDDVMDALNHTVITTAKRTIIEIGKMVTYKKQ